MKISPRHRRTLDNWLKASAYQEAAGNLPITLFVSWQKFAIDDLRVRRGMPLTDLMGRFGRDTLGYVMVVKMKQEEARRGGNL